VGGLLGDYLTGGAGNDAFVFHLETITNGVTVSTELGKSTAAVKQDFITDFTPGQDTIFIQNDNGDNNYAIAYYNSVTADATFMNSGAATCRSWSVAVTTTSPPAPSRSSVLDPVPAPTTRCCS
jgi:Ca2+-binding RTX toxin-like protein